MIKFNCVRKSLLALILLLGVFISVDSDASVFTTVGFYNSVEFIGKIKFDENPLGVAYGHVYKGSNFLSLIRDLNINSTHINIRWKEIEPSIGRFKWSAVDSFVAQLKYGDRALIRIRTDSKWTSRGGSSLPSNMKHYTTFIRKLVERTHGKVQYFESDWEIDSRKSWNDTPEHYVVLLKAFYKTVKSENPKATVIFGGHSGHFKNYVPTRVEIINYIFEHGSAYFDMFDLHLYHDLYDIPYRVSWFKKDMKIYGIEKPIVVTEYGGPTLLEYPDKMMLAKLQREIKQDYRVFENGLLGYPPGIRMFAPNIPAVLEEAREWLHAAEIVQRTLLIISSGPKMVWYWNLSSNGKHPIFGKLGLMEPMGVKKDAYEVYRRMAIKLGGIKMIKRLDMTNPEVYAYKIWSRDGRIVHVLWAKPSQYWQTDHPVVSLPVASDDVKIENVLGEPQTPNILNGELLLELTELPIFVEQGLCHACNVK